MIDAVRAWMEHFDESQSSAPSSPRECRVLVTGGRDFDGEDWLRRVLDGIKPTFIVQGAASGADLLARDYAIKRKIPVASEPADWKRHGKAAGPIRNRYMLKRWLPDIVLAFPGGRGTCDMVQAAHDAGVPVVTAI